MKKNSNKSFQNIETIFDWKLKENYSSFINFVKKKNNLKYIKYFSKKNKIKNYNYCKKIYEKKVIGNFAYNLNKYHGTNFSVKYWEIIVHDWLFLNLNLFYDYWNLSDLLIKNKTYKIYKINNQLLEYKISRDCNTQSNYYHYWILSEIIKYKKN